MCLCVLCAVCVCGFKQFIKWREREKRSWAGFCDEPHNVGAADKVLLLVLTDAVDAVAGELARVGWLVVIMNRN